jgi:hypothetical protein
LFNEVDDNRIAATLRRLADPDEACRELVRLANEAGGRDNITCVIVDIVDDSGRDPDADISRRVRTAHTGGDPVVSDRPERAARPMQKSSGRLRRSVTWRVGAFVAAFVLVVVIAFAFIWWTGTKTWYVGINGDDVAIFHGKPGGVLWIDPQLAETTSLTASEVPAVALADVTAGVEQPSLSAAHRYVDNLIEQRAKTTTTTTPSSSTTRMCSPVSVRTRASRRTSSPSS